MLRRATGALRDRMASSVVEVVGLRKGGRVVEGWAAGDHGASGDPLGELERRGQGVLATLGPAHHADRSDPEVIEQGMTSARTQGSNP